MLLTQNDLGEMLSLAPPAVSALIATREIPHVAIIGGTMYFCPEEVIAWGKTRPNIKLGGIQRVRHYKTRFLEEAPDAAEDLKEFGRQFAERKPPKLYYLVRMPSKKLGYTWYVKYSDRGRLVPSKWSAGTSDKSAAEAFAVKSREAILSGYYARKAKKPADMYKLFESYYEKGSELLEADVNRGRALCDRRRRVALNAVKKKFVPFLRKSGAREIGDIDAAMLSRFQDRLLKTLSAKTVNDVISAARMMFKRLVATGYASANPFAGLPSVKKGESKMTGCYEVGKVRGVFDGEWENPAHRLHCLLIYSTNMRNCEIQKIRLGDVEEVGGETFLNVRGTKTESAARRVPLHPFVLEKLREYAGGRDPAFPQNQKRFVKLCSAANVSMGELMGHAPETLKAENIRFYSGRKFWKTLMASEGLGRDTEEYFMGHKVSSDVEKLYKDLTKVGAEKLAEKAREVLAVLDRRLFGG